MKKIIATCLFTLFLVSSLFAQSNTQTNFTIAPPPLGYPEFPRRRLFLQQNRFFVCLCAGKGFFIAWDVSWLGSSLWQ
jgi:hypothetical protein